MPGRPRLPTQQLTPGWERKAPGRLAMRLAEPVYPDADPTPPPWLTDAAKRNWSYYFPLLQQQGVITAADKDTLASYCQALADKEECHAIICRDGWTITTSQGNISKHPLCLTLNQREAQAISLAAHLGFTPSTRSRTRATQKVDARPKTDFDGL